VATKCRTDALNAGLDELTIDRLLDGVNISSKSGRELVEDIIEQQKTENFLGNSNLRTKERHNRFIQMARYTADNTVRPYRKMWKFIADDKNSMGGRVTTRHQRSLSNIQQEANISTRDMFTLIEGHIISRNADLTFRNEFITEMMSESTSMQSKNKVAYQLASAVKKQQALQVAESRAYGSGLYHKPGWVTSQYHDPLRIKAATKEQWVEDILGDLDVGKTKANAIAHMDYDYGVGITQSKWDTKKYLEEVWDSITNPKIHGQGQILDSMKHRRIFEFKDANSLLNYNSKYGHENLAHAIFQNLQAMDNYLEVGMVMGYGYKQTLEVVNNGKKSLKTIKYDPISDLRSIWEELRGQNKITKREYGNLNAALTEIVGDHSLAGNPRISQLTSGFIAWQAMSKLGNAVFSASADLGSAGIVLHHQGVRPDKGYYGMTQNMLRIATDQLDPLEKKLVHQALAAGNDGMIMQSYSRYVGQWGGKAGELSKLANHFFWMNGLIGWTNNARTAFSIMSSNQLANSLTGTWKGLGKVQREHYIKYGFNADDWKEMQRIGSFNARLWNPDANKLENYITRDWIIDNKGSAALGMKLDNFFIQESRSAVPEAKIADRVNMYGNHDKGSGWDVTRKLAGMFRTYQLQQVKTLYPRIRELGLPAIVHALPIVGLGYTSVVLKNLVKGKEPPEFDDPNLFVDVMVNSGFAPLVGDYLAGEYGRYNHTWDEAVGGAAYSQFKEWGSLWAGLVNGNKGAADVYKSLQYNTPFANLFYTQAALNYGIHYGMMESLNPGYLNRIEAQAEGRGSPFLYNPSNIHGGY